MEGVKRQRNAERPYDPSWFDRFEIWIERLPGSVWIYYAGAALLNVSIFVGVQLWQGAYSEQGFYPWHIFLGLQPIIPLALMHNLDRLAVSALQRFKPAFASRQLSITDASYRMTTMPARKALVATLAGIVIYFVLFSRSVAEGSMTDFQLSQTTASRISVLANFLVMWAFNGLLIYHTIHQIVVIRKLFAYHTRADLYNQEPLYAFSSITGQTALVLLLNSYGWVWELVQSGAMETNPVSALGVNLAFTVLSLFIFIWPLWGAHQLLVEAKSDALAKNATVMSKAVGELHSKVNARHSEDLGEWENALNALDIERRRVERAPTWPWRPEALRGLIAALIVPIVVWFAQYLLERILG